MLREKLNKKALCAYKFKQMKTYSLDKNLTGTMKAMTILKSTVRNLSSLV